ncbi:MAG: serine acetyltransferase [Polyangiaceae bacterium]|nr:serine acetyltransferase [Polyangiaceae bacterium]MCW5791160.1 serine acetyltransferase [Polyangiaceae bacterium]
MGFYSTRSLSRGTLKSSMREHLVPAFDALVEQIQRAMRYEARLGRGEDQEAGWAEEVVLQLFRELPRLRELLNTDVVAAYDGDPAAKSIEEIVFSYPAVRAITAHRIAHQLHLSGVPMLPRIISEHAHSETGIDIHAGARIGERFFIDHGTGVVIGETAEIGRNVKIYQGVTLGALSTRRAARGAAPDAAASNGSARAPEARGPAARTTAPLTNKRHPTIEDDVTIYSGATILGGETVIGRGSVIGGNTWLTRSVPPGTRLLGRSREGTDDPRAGG